MLQYTQMFVYNAVYMFYSATYLFEEDQDTIGWKKIYRYYLYYDHYVLNMLFTLYSKTI